MSKYNKFAHLKKVHDYRYPYTSAVIDVDERGTCSVVEAVPHKCFSDLIRHVREAMPSAKGFCVTNKEKALPPLSDKNEVLLMEMHGSETRFTIVLADVEHSNERLLAHADERRCHYKTRSVEPEYVQYGGVAVFEVGYTPSALPLRKYI